MHLLIIIIIMIYHNATILNRSLENKKVFQMALTLKLCLFDPHVGKPKMSLGGLSLFFGNCKQTAEIIKVF